MEKNEIEKLREENEKLKEEIENLKSSQANQKQIQKKAMADKAEKGDIVSRAPFGYKIENKKLVPAENFREIEEIFEEFLNEKVSLRRLAEKHNFSVNGLKKILRNFTYLGKVRFDGQIHQGNHEPIISPILFNRVQDKLKKLKIN